MPLRIWSSVLLQLKSRTVSLHVVSLTACWVKQTLMVSERLILASCPDLTFNHLHWSLQYIVVSVLVTSSIPFTEPRSFLPLWSNCCYCSANSVLFCTARVFLSSGILLLDKKNLLIRFASELLLTDGVASQTTHPAFCPQCLEVEVSHWRYNNIFSGTVWMLLCH